MINASITIHFVPQSCFNAAHHMASLATKEQTKGPWNSSESIDDVMKSNVMSKEHNVIHANI